MFCACLFFVTKYVFFYKKNTHTALQYGCFIICEYCYNSILFFKDCKPKKLKRGRFYLKTDCQGICASRTSYSFEGLLIWGHKCHYYN